MKNFRFGQGFSIELADNHRCEFILYTGKIFNELYIDIWDNDSRFALYTIKKRFFRWERVFGDGFNLNRRLTDRKLDKTIEQINKKLKKLGINDNIKKIKDGLRG